MIKALTIFLILFTAFHSFAQCISDCRDICSGNDCTRYFTLDDKNAFECQVNGDVSYDRIDSLCITVTQSNGYVTCTNNEALTPIAYGSDTVQICNDFIVKSNTIEYFETAYCGTNGFAGFSRYIKHEIFDQSGNLVCCVESYNSPDINFNVGDTLRHCMTVDYAWDTTEQYYKYISWTKIPDSTTASFEGSGCTGSPTCFNNTSIWGDSVKFYWDFNQDQIWDDTIENPCYTFNTAGNYPVTLITCSELGPDSVQYMCDTVTLNVLVVDTQAVLNFSYSKNCTDTVIFLNDSLNCPDSLCAYKWHFGDGDSSLQDNPAHIYPDSGVYSTCLIINYSCGSDTLCKNIFINYPPEAGFLYSDSMLSVNLTDTSLYADQWTWYFGNGDSSLNQNPLYTYDSTGIYEVCLIVSNFCYKDTLCKMINLSCLATSDTISAFTCNSYTSPSGKYTWTTSGTYIDTIPNTAGCDSVITIDLTIEPDECVWPGDANNNGIANAWDILNIGIAYEYTGYNRLNPVTEWIGQNCADWNTSFADGMNYKFADCNGDGVINYDDVEPVYENYGSVHSKNINSTFLRLSDDSLLSVLINEDSTEAGTILSGEVRTGESEMALYGIAMTISYTAFLVDSGTFNVGFSNSWLGSDSVDMITFSQDRYSDGAIDISLSRTDGQNKIGKGELASFNIIMMDDLSGKDIFKEFKINITAVTAITNTQDTVWLNTKRDSAIVYQKESIIDATKKESFHLYPNPADKKVYIKSNLPIDEIIVFDLMGKEIYKEENISNKIHIINTIAWEPGVYIIKSKGRNKVFIRKIILK